MVPVAAGGLKLPRTRRVPLAEAVVVEVVGAVTPVTNNNQDDESDRRPERNHKQDAEQPGAVPSESVEEDAVSITHWWGTPFASERMVALRPLGRINYP